MTVRGKDIACPEHHIRCSWYTFTLYGIYPVQVRYRYSQAQDQKARRGSTFQDRNDRKGYVDVSRQLGNCNVGGYGLLNIEIQ